MMFIKFILVGVLNTIFGYLVWALMIYSGLHYAISSILSSIIGILFNFKTTGTLVFKNKDNLLIFKFVQIYAVITALYIAGLKVAKTFGFNIYLSGFALTVVFAFLSFLLQKEYVFKRK